MIGAEMDASTSALLMDALGLGVQTAMTEAVKIGVGDLVEKVKAKFQTDSGMAAVVDAYAKDPNEGLSAMVLRGLEEQGVVVAGEVVDAELVEEAKQLLSQVRTYTVHGDNAVVIGDQRIEGGAHAYIGGTHVTNNFADRSAGARPRWSIEHYRGSRFKLTNTSDAPAFDVELDVPGAGRFERPAHEERRCENGEARTFFAATSWGGGDELEVVYRDEPDTELRVWRHPLPPAGH